MSGHSDHLLRPCRRHPVSGGVVQEESRKLFPIVRVEFNPAIAVSEEEKQRVANCLSTVVKFDLCMFWKASSLQPPHNIAFEKLSSHERAFQVLDPHIFSVEPIVPKVLNTGELSTIGLAASSSSVCFASVAMSIHQKSWDNGRQTNPSTFPWRCDYHILLSSCLPAVQNLIDNFNFSLMVGIHSKKTVGGWRKNQRRNG